MNQKDKAPSSEHPDLVEYNLARQEGSIPADLTFEQYQDNCRAEALQQSVNLTQIAAYINNFMRDHNPGVLSMDPEDINENPDETMYLINETFILPLLADPAYGQAIFGFGTGEEKYKNLEEHWGLNDNSAIIKEPGYAEEDYAPTGRSTGTSVYEIPNGVPVMLDPSIEGVVGSPSENPPREDGSPSYLVDAVDSGPQ